MDDRYKMAYETLKGILEYRDEQMLEMKKLLFHIKTNYKLSEEIIERINKL